MKPDTSRWRDSANYDYFDDLSVEGLAWECLRRDETYQDQYQAIARASTEAEPLPREVEQRWGLRFRGETISQLDRAIHRLVAARQPWRRDCWLASRFRRRRPAQGGRRYFHVAIEPGRCSRLHR
ncbi:transcriptional regulator domain-containing protein [Azorhizobium doebereinerae]|uniref:transcriptional regulator domain-containing protein n=1 Tax=Azorhizobium doebereinerae TaxID=281091 RepID=UPI001FD8A809|nr:DUF6499 domain-containing protein [Azorhizobium doebereinerae]